MDAESKNPHPSTDYDSPTIASKTVLLTRLIGRYWELYWSSGSWWGDQCRHASLPGPLCAVSSASTVKTAVWRFRNNHRPPGKLVNEVQLGTHEDNLHLEKMKKKLRQKQDHRWAKNTRSLFPFSSILWLKISEISFLFLDYLKIRIMTLCKGHFHIDH